ncbi:nucleotidyltransferase domain-containing protein [Candidatus Woesearchaeota archaeon]|nr:nucleotidyltransferase domain-containing protein [Candidatus Woesearchaeota archaeon]
MGTTTDPKIKDFVKRVQNNFKIAKAIFFGSRARGDHFKNSDYDIILVSQDFEGIFFTKRISMMYDFWRYYPLEIEPICYTPKEFSQKKKEIGLVRQAVKEGINLVS